MRQASPYRKSRGLVFVFEGLDSIRLRLIALGGHPKPAIDGHLKQLGWTLRRIEKETGVRRKTASGYLRAAGLVVRPPGRWGRLPLPSAKPAIYESAAPCQRPDFGFVIGVQAHLTPLRATEPRVRARVFALRLPPFPSLRKGVSERPGSRARGFCAA
jgi:hypothetical protein